MKHDISNMIACQFEGLAQRPILSGKDVGRLNHCSKLDRPSTTIGSHMIFRYQVTPNPRPINGAVIGNTFGMGWENITLEKHIPDANCFQSDFWRQEFKLLRAIHD